MYTERAKPDPRNNTSNQENRHCGVAVDASNASNSAASGANKIKLVLGMELLDSYLLSVFATTFVVCALLAAVLTLVAWLISAPRAHVLALYVSAFCFALLGFVVGSIMANSREPAVGAVLPAVLTLLGGVLIYLIGSKGYEKQISTSALIICFAAALYVGSSYGARLRYNFEIVTESPIFLRQRELSLEANRHAVEVQRLLNYIQLLKLERDFSKEQNIDLSRFESISQHPQPGQAGPQAAKSSTK